MVKLLEIRSLLRMYYQKLQMVIDPLLKFIAAFVTFQTINSAMGFDERISKLAIVVLLSLLCAFTPSAVLVLLAMGVVLLHIYAMTPIMAVMALLIFGILYCFFLRFAPKYGYVVVAIPVLYTLQMPYLVPLLLGIFATPMTIFPATCGVVVYFLFQIMKTQAENNSTAALEDALKVYMEVFEEILECRQILIVSGVFAIVITAVYVIRRLKMEYAAEIALLAGAVINVFGFLICDLKFGITGEIGFMLLGTLLSLLAAFVALFFKRVLDYTAVENVQFEDDDYYYYVKAVPKVGIGIQQRKVKQITSKQEELLEEDDLDEYEEILDEETGEVIFKPKKRKSGNKKSQEATGGSAYMYRRQQEEQERRERETGQAAFAPPAEEPMSEFERERRAAKSYEAGEENFTVELDGIPEVTPEEK